MINGQPFSDPRPTLPDHGMEPLLPEVGAAPLSDGEPREYRPLATSADERARIFKPYTEDHARNHDGLRLG